ncbi:hypothetical protein Tco_0531827 [Tanacetum coccineum]
MSSITAQQTKLDLELVPKEKKPCDGDNDRKDINTWTVQREPTFYYVPEVYMHQFWDSVYKHDTFYRFKMDKRKRFKLNLESSMISSRYALGVQVSSEEPTKKSKRVKRSTKKSTKAPAGGVIIRETLEMPLSKKKEKSDVARDFHKTHLSGSGTVTKTAPSAAKIKPSVTSEGTGVKLGVPDVTEEESSEMDDDNNSIRTMEKQDIRLNEPVDTDKGFVQEEGTDAAMTNVHQGNGKSGGFIKRYVLNHNLLVKSVQSWNLSLRFEDFGYATRSSGDPLGISHWREQRKTFYGDARGLQSTHDVYSTKRILAVTQVEVIRKHGYGYLKEIIVRRADNDLYRFKEGDFQRLRINDIEDMLLFFVQNWLTNLLGDDVSDFVIALRMFARSLVIQKRVEDLQLGNIRMEYLPKRRWSTLEKKRANIMIKAIDKQLKERRTMRSLKKFVGGRDYGTDLRLLQQTI